jgi:uncharacterized protein YecT (DUF1311 family)
MLLASLVLALSQNPDNSGYLYVQRECVPQNDGTDPIFWGLYKGECEDVAVADRDLNLAYRHAIARSHSAQKVRLRNEQRSWIISTNRMCDLSDGTAMNSDAADCFIQEAKLRTAVLSQWNSGDNIK